MRLSCPSCKTTFEIPAKRASVGKKARCVRCSTVFRIPGSPKPEAVPRAPADEMSSGQRTAFEDLQAATAEVASSENTSRASDKEAGRTWGEPESEADSRAAPVPERPAIDPPRGAMSAIRAQSGASVPAEADHIEDLRGAWILRLSDGGVRNFDSIEDVHSFLEASPDPEAEVSSDGKIWNPPESLRAMQAHRGALREPTGLSVALRAAASTRPPDPETTGVGWFLAAVLSTLLMLGSVALTLQTLAVVDLSGWVPFEALGLSAIADLRDASPLAQDEPEDPEIATRRAYSKLMEKAASARAAGQLVDAAMVYQTAVDTLESPEALEALAELFETLGEGRRARAMRTRLESLREKREKRTP